LKQEAAMNAVYWARFFREKDGRWSVDVPDMPGCLTWGETIEEAYSRLTGEAIPGWLGNDPWPPARDPEEILGLDRFEDDAEPLLVRVALAGSDETLVSEAGPLHLRPAPEAPETWPR
jgi:predicted RNase H-like HicB family nuclease